MRRTGTLETIVIGWAIMLAFVLALTILKGGGWG